MHGYVARPSTIGESLGQRHRTVEGLGMSPPSTHWTARRVLVTGASGFVGSWVVKALLERQAEVSALVREVDYRSELVRSGAVRQLSVVNGCLEDYATVERAINEHEADTVFHLAAQGIVG